MGMFSNLSKIDIELDDFEEIKSVQRYDLFSTTNDVLFVLRLSLGNDRKNLDKER